MTATTVEQTLCVLTPGKPGSFTEKQHIELFAALGLPRQRYKAYGDRYIFTVTDDQLAAVAPLLDRWGVTFEVEVTRRYTPAVEQPTDRQVLLTAYDPDGNVADEATFVGTAAASIGNWLATFVTHQTLDHQTPLAGSVEFTPVEVQP